MKAGLVTFSVGSAVTWAILFYVSAQAVAAMGLNAAGGRPASSRLSSERRIKLDPVSQCDCPVGRSKAPA
jgi:hypothetical protein